MSVNKVILLGRIGQDPELKYTPNGNAVCNLSVATSESWNDKSGNKQERTEWNRIVVWDKLAELCGQYLSKGREVYIEGKLQTRSWDDKDGNKRYATEIIAHTAQFIGGQNENSKPQQAKPQQQAPQNSPQPQVNADFASDSIPF